MAYIDYKWLYSLHLSKVFFVTRAKSNIYCVITGQHEMATDKGLIFDRLSIIDLLSFSFGNLGRLRKPREPCSQMSLF